MRARACAEYVSAEPRGRHGGYVRHWALADQLDKGRDAAVNVARLVRMSPADKVGLAIAGPYRLAAEIIRQYPLDEGEAAWNVGMRRAAATGTRLPVVYRRALVYEALSIAKKPLAAADLEIWDRHAADLGAGVVVLAIQAGYAASEVTAELLADHVGLAVAAALNANVEAA
jgi:hypothetical protein